MSIIQLPNGKHRVQIRRKGYPKYDKVFATRQEAEDAEASIRGEQKAVEAPVEITLSECWARYCQSQSFLQKAEKTRSTEAGRIQPVLAELGSYSLANLQNAPTLIYDYIDKRSSTISARTKKKLSTTSVRLEIAALSSVIAFAKQRKIVQANFIRQIGRPAQAKRKRRVDGVEVAGLRTVALSSDARAAEAARFALLLRYIGCRPGELARVRRVDISLSKSELTFRNTKHKQKDRLIHLTKTALGMMDTQIRYCKDSEIDSEYVFSTRTKASPAQKPEYVFYNYESGIKLLRRLGVIEKSFHAHAMRREFISKAIETGLPYATIRKQTGHHSTQAIEIYDEGLSTAPEIREALDKHEHAISADEVTGMMRRMGATPEQIKAAKRVKRIGAIKHAR
jgi:integrase